MSYAQFAYFQLFKFFYLKKLLFYFIKLYYIIWRIVKLLGKYKPENFYEIGNWIGGVNEFLLHLFLNGFAETSLKSFSTVSAAPAASFIIIRADAGEIVTGSG